MSNYVKSKIFSQLSILEQPVNNSFTFEENIEFYQGNEVDIISFDNTNHYTWGGGVLALNGKIYGIPRTGGTVLEIDPSNGTVNTISVSGWNSERWNGGVLAPNGKIYGMPSTRKVLEIDPSNGSAIMFASGLVSESMAGGVLAPNGTIYGIPNSGDKILTIKKTFPRLMTDWVLYPQFNKY